LRFLWGNETCITGNYPINSACTLNADPIIKMAAIEAIEATGNILFDYTARVAQVTKHHATGIYVLWRVSFHC